ncbi:MAG: prolyl oligopeptidase family serine peptidase [Muribaculaceae bacterium]|nr:prolyl oligopeptidase family serine peptidase [Muribaculaceae bacterium]
MKRVIMLSLMIATIVVCFSKTLMKTTTDTIIVPTTHLGTPMHVTVTVPARYLSTLDNDNYPVVYLLNGYTGDNTDYARHMNLDSLANVNNVIIVCPDGRDSWYWDTPKTSGMEMESFFVKDLIPTIDREFRTLPRPESRAIAGLSMGGHGALWLAMRHKDLFGNAGTMSGGVDITPKEFQSNWQLRQLLGEYDKNKKSWKNHTVQSLVKKLKPGQLNLIVCCGSEDFFFPVNENLHASLDKRGIKHTYIIEPGGHTWPYWNSTLPVILEFFNQHLAR